MSGPATHIVDDDPAVRDALQWLLKSRGVQSSAWESAEDFLSSASSELCGCLLLDVRMPGMSGLALQDELARRGSILPVVFITGHGDVPMAVETIKKGAVDFLQKPFSDEVLCGAVRHSLDRSAQSLRASTESRELMQRIERLTSRERQVLERIVVGRLNKQIADDLCISIKTVEAHRANIMEKLNANTVADLLKIALGALAKA